MVERIVDQLMDKVKVWAAFAFLVLFPISYSAGDIRVFQEKTLILCAMSYVSLFFGNIWITLFFLFNMAGYLVNGSVVGSGQITNIFMASLLFTIFRALFLKHKIDFIETAIKWLVVVNGVFLIFQLFGIDPIMMGTMANGAVRVGKTFDTTVGLFHFQAAMGMFFCIAMPFMIRRSWLLGLLCLVPIYLSKSAGVYLAAFAVLLYSIFYIRMVTFRFRPLYWLITVACVLGAIGGVYYDYKKDSLTGGSRFENWHLYLKMGMTRPIFGHGPDSFRNLTPSKKYLFVSDENYNPALLDFTDPQNAKFRYHSADEGKRIARFRGKTPTGIPEWKEAHNEYLQIFFEYGIFGLILVGFFLSELYRRFRLCMESQDVRVLFGCILAYLIFSIVQFPFHLARTAVFFPIILGAIWALTDKDYDLFVKGEQYGT